MLELDHLAPPLHFPLGTTPPALGTLAAIRPGVQWVRMPLPFALDHINLWVLDDHTDGQDSWCVVDAGASTPDTHAAWQGLWTQAMGARPLGRMVVTHMHPDHVGNAQWLIEHFSAAGRAAPLWMSAADYLAARLSSGQTLSHGGERAAQFFASHGLLAPQAQQYIRERGQYYSSMVPAVPLAYHRLHDHLRLQVGPHEWHCILGLGHAPEHMALYAPNLGLLISGDMLLPKISTNVSVTDLEPEADPLGLFLDSLDRFEALPVDTLVLPSHGLPFVGIHARVAALRTHHNERLDEVRACCRTHPCSAADLLPVLFKRTLDLHQTTFAMGEALAHLNHLWVAGELQRERDAQGVWRFSPAQ